MLTVMLTVTLTVTLTVMLTVSPGGESRPNNEQEHKQHRRGHKIQRHMSGPGARKPCLRESGASGPEQDADR